MHLRPWARPDRFSRSPGCDRAPADSPEALGYLAPVTRSLPAPLVAAMAWSTVS